MRAHAGRAHTLIHVVIIASGVDSESDGGVALCYQGEKFIA